MRFELKVVLIIAEIRKAPLVVFINENEIDIDHRIDLIEQGAKIRQKYDEACSEHKAATKKLFTELRSALHGAPKVVPVTTVTMDGVSLEYQMYQSTFKDEGW